jgi:mannose-6-phosphate isomerase-like protein (cupin superfamily)
MDSSNAAFDLSRTFILIDDGPKAMPLPVGPDFWKSIAQSSVANSPTGRLVSLTDQLADWTHWEMHPANDEILFMLSGSMELIVEEKGSETVVRLESLCAFIVPRGTWHRGRVRVPGKLLGITGGAGTQHKPIASFIDVGSAPSQEIKE